MMTNTLKDNEYFVINDKFKNHKKFETYIVI